MSTDDLKGRSKQAVAFVFGVLIGVAIGGLARGGVMGHGARFNDSVRALAELIRACAWPVVAVLLLVRFRDRLGELFNRLVELPGGAKFAPPQQQDAKSSIEGLTPLAEVTGLAQQVAIGGIQAFAVDDADEKLPATFEAVRTAEVIASEKAILATPDLVNTKNPSTRERILSTLAALLFVDWNFERIEGNIWASQLHILQAVNSASIPRDWIRANIYEKAATAFPDWFKGYPFDAYLGFLKSHNLIEEKDGNIEITSMGRDYLAWRVRRGKRPSKAFG
jgi:hypothetical protein